MHKLKTAKQQFIDRFQRELDEIERVAPMRGSYERIRPYIVDHSVGGEQYEFIVYHKESESWFGAGTFDWSLQFYHDHQFVRPGDVAFDIGSNSGAIATYLGLKVGPRGRVVAFDPFPWNALATHYNARLNHLDNVWAYAIGIGDTTFDLNLALDAARTLEGGCRAGETIPARVVDIADFAHEQPTFMKIDIEGAEYELSRTDWGRFTRLERIFLELHPFFIEDRGLATRDVLRNLSRASFSLRHGHPAAAVADVETVEPGHGGWWLTRSIAALAAAA
jgi:hypothetical protein